MWPFLGITREQPVSHASCSAPRQPNGPIFQHKSEKPWVYFVPTALEDLSKSAPTARPGGCPSCWYAVSRGAKAPDDALARELGAMGLL